MSEMSSNEASLDAAIAHLNAACEAAVHLGSASLSIHRVDPRLVSWALAHGGKRNNFRKTKTMAAWWNVDIKIAGVSVTLYPALPR